MVLMVLPMSAALAHRWSAEDCGVAGNDAQVISMWRDDGVSEVDAKMRVLYIMHRPDPKTTYQDAEDLYIFLSIVDYVYTHPTDSFAELGPRITTACRSGLNRV